MLRSPGSSTQSQLNSTIPTVLGPHHCREPGLHLYRRRILRSPAGPGLLRSPQRRTGSIGLDLGADGVSACGGAHRNPTRPRRGTPGAGRLTLEMPMDDEAEVLIERITDARRKRRTTVIDSPQNPVQSWTGCAGSTAASWRAGPPRGTSPKCRRHGGLAVEAADEDVGAQGYREGSIVQSPFHRPARCGRCGTMKAGCV